VNDGSERVEIRRLEKKAVHRSLIIFSGSFCHLFRLFDLAQRHCLAVSEIQAKRHVSK